jgi:HAD superfamily hydrolase (TIGR01484 family)
MMRMLTDFPASARSRIRGVLLDLDDTLTTGGRLTSDAYCALERLYDADLITVLVTGRPAGWCDHIARMWPVRAVVGEGGSLCFWRDVHANRLRQMYVDPAEVRRRNRAALVDIASRILAEVPGCALSSDQPYRECDLAIDWCEDVARLPMEKVDRILALMRESGLNAAASAGHVNGWFGDYDKLGMTRRFFHEILGIDLDAQRESFVYLGDSPNDCPMFRFFPHSIGVANVMDVRDRLTHAPTYITARRSGDGFCEAVEALFQVR